MILILQGLSGLTITQPLGLITQNSPCCNMQVIWNFKLSKSGKEKNISTICISYTIDDNSVLSKSRLGKNVFQYVGTIVHDMKSSLQSYEAVIST